MKNNKNKGFTLIELLVVIAIIGLLSTLAVIALSNARQKSRDSRRVSDIKQIQSALELFYNDAGKYPDGAAVNEIVDDGLKIAYSGTIYMSKAPKNPEPGAIAYQYIVRDSGASYTIEYALESGAGGIIAGTWCATPAGIDNGQTCHT